MKKNETIKKKTPDIVPALYLGERVSAIGNIHQVFKAPMCGELFFKGIKQVHFGDSYEYDRANGTMKTRPKQIKGRLKASIKDEHTYHAQKEIVKLQRLKNRKALEIKKPHKDIDRAIELLRPFTNGMGSIDLHRFVEYLENRLSKGRRK